MDGGERSAGVELSDGKVVRVRPACPEDIKMVIRIHRFSKDHPAAKGGGQGARRIVAGEQVVARVELDDAVVAGVVRVRRGVEHEDIAGRIDRDISWPGLRWGAKS